MDMVFIVGAPRSGTTLLQNLLACHPQIDTCPETHFLTHVTPCLLYERGLPPIGKKPLPAKLAQPHAEDLLSTAAGLLNPGDTANRRPATIPDGDEVPLADVARLFFSILSREGRSVFVEKSPPHVFFVPEILALFPKAKIVNIVRDPRDVLSSLGAALEEMGKSPRSIFERAQVWNASVANARRHDLFTIRYEDLVTNQKSEIEKVFSYLGMSAGEADLSQQNAVAARSVRAKETWKKYNFGPVSANHVGLFTRQLSADDVALIERLCACGMKRYSYASTGQKHSRRRLASEMFAYYKRRVGSLRKAGFGSKFY